MKEATAHTSSEVPVRDADWRRFYDAHWQWVYRVVRRMSGGQINVEDAVQDVFVVVVDRIADFEGRAKIQTWLYRICLNVVSEHRRKRIRRQRLAYALDKVAFWRTDPTRLLEARDELQLVNALLGQMEEKKRQVLILAEVEQLTGPEIAEILEIPAATVRTRLHHARKDFAARLERHRKRERT